MTLTELRYIVTLAQEQHFGRAAERCHVSQPTLSIGVKKLEDSLGVALFERTRTAVRLTPVGEQVVARAQQVLEAARAVEETARQGQDQLNSPLRLGAIYTLGPYLFPRLVPLVHQEVPAMPLYLEENFTEVLRGKLRRGELDAILVALPFEESDVLVRSLYEEPFVMILPEQHPWVARPSVNAAEVKDTRLLMLGEGHCFRDQVLEACPGMKPGQPSALVTEGSSLETLRLMVASGLGASVVPLSAAGPARELTSVVVKPFAEPRPARTLALAWRASFPRPRAIEVLIGAIGQCRQETRDHDG